MLSIGVGAAYRWLRARGGGSCCTPIGSLLLDRGFVPRVDFGGQAVRWQGADGWLTLQRVDSCSGLLHLAGQVVGVSLEVGESAGGVRDVGIDAVGVEPLGAGLGCTGVRGLGVGGSAGRGGQVVSCFAQLGMVLLGGSPGVGGERLLDLWRLGVMLLSN